MQNSGTEELKSRLIWALCKLTPRGGNACRIAAVRTTVFFTVVALSSLAAIGQTRTVALSGQMGSGSPRPFSIYLNDAAINDHGDVAFVSLLDGWLSPGDGSQPILLNPPGSPGTNFIFADGLVPPVVNDPGQVLFVGSDTSNIQDGIFSTASGSTKSVAQYDGPAPGGHKFTSAFYYSNSNFGLYQFAMNSAGRAAFVAEATLIPGYSIGTAGVWVQNASGNLETITQVGFGTPATFTSVAINDHDQVAIGSTGPEGSVLLRNADGSLRTIVSVGDLAPGANGSAFGDTPNTFALIDMNKAGDVVFQGDTTNGFRGVWENDSSGLHLVAGKGMVAPGTSATFARAFEPVIDATGDIAFVGTLSHTNSTTINDTGLWESINGQLKLMAREGDVAPGTSGALFDDFLNVAPLLNSAGRLAFAAALQLGGDVTSANYGGIWEQDAQGVLRLVVRFGDTIEVAPGDFRTISTLRFTAPASGGEDGRIRAVNDQGQLLYYAQFTDGTGGLFVATVVPEPASGILALIASLTGVLLVRRGSRRK